MAPTPTSFTHAPVRGLLFHTLQHQMSLQTLPHTSLMHLPRLPLGLPASPPTHISHTPLACAGHVGPSLPYVGRGTGWTRVGVSWADVWPMLTYFESMLGPLLGVAGPKLAILSLCRPPVGPMLAYLGRCWPRFDVCWPYAGIAQHMLAACCTCVGPCCLMLGVPAATLAMLALRWPYVGKKQVRR